MFQRAAGTGTGRGSTPLTIIHLIKLSVCLFPLSPWKRLRVTSDLHCIHSNQTSFSGKEINRSELQAACELRPMQIKKDNVLLLILVSSQNQSRSLASFYAPVSELYQTAHPFQLTLAPWRTPKERCSPPTLSTRLSGDRSSLFIIRGKWLLQ